MCLAGRAYSAQQMHEWGVVNAVVDEGGDVVAEAVRWAVEIAGNSPDAVIVSRQGVMAGWDGTSAQVRCFFFLNCLIGKPPVDTFCSLAGWNREDYAGVVSHD